MRKSHRNAPFVYIAGRAANTLLMPLGAVLLPGVLGEEGYGRYGYWFGLITVYVVLLDLGTQPMLRRYLPELEAGEGAQARTLLKRALWLKFIPLPLLLAAAWFSSQPTLMFALTIAALFAAFATNLADVFYARQRMLAHSFAVLSRKLGRLLLVPLFFLLWGVPGILIALVVAETLGLLVSTPALKGITGTTKPLDIGFGQRYRQGLLVFVGMAASILIGRLPVLSAEWSGMSLEAIGRIALCVDLVYFALKELLNAVSESVFPQLIVHRAAGRQAQVERIIALNYRAVNFVGLGAIALGMGLAASFLPLLGDQFYLAERDFRILLAGVLFSCWNLIHSHLLLLDNQGLGIALSQSAGLLVSLVSFVLYWGHMNTLVFTVTLGLAMVTTALVSHLLVREKTPKGCIWPFFLRLLPVAILVGWLLNAWHPTGIWETSLALATGGLGYIGAALLAGGLPREDLDFFRLTLRERTV